LLGRCAAATVEFKCAAVNTFSLPVLHDLLNLRFPESRSEKPAVLCISVVTVANPGRCDTLRIGPSRRTAKRKEQAQTACSQPAAANGSPTKVRRPVQYDESVAFRVPFRIMGPFDRTPRVECFFRIYRRSRKRIPCWSRSLLVQPNQMTLELAPLGPLVPWLFCCASPIAEGIYIPIILLFLEPLVLARFLSVSS
jgi:hypothetical protein